MKITKIIAAFMVAGLIGTAGCDSAVEEPAGGPTDPMDSVESVVEMEAEMGDGTVEPGTEAEEAAPAAEEEAAPAAEEEAAPAAEEAAAPAAEEEAAPAAEAAAPKSDE
jgi:light-harvesting protein B-800-850 alpha chain